MIVIVFLFHSLSIDVALFRLSRICLCCSVLLDLSMFLSSVMRLARLSLCRVVVRLARLSLSVVLFLVDVLFVFILLYCLLPLSLIIDNRLN